MSRITEYLTCIRQIMKLHDQMMKEVSSQFGLTLIEADIIGFLYNNPEKDTAGDIVELRMLSKGNVSRAVESLIQKSLLKRTPDTADRRKIHLSLLPSSAPVTKEIEEMQRHFRARIYRGFSPEEIRTLESLNRKLLKNTRIWKERRERR